MLSWIEIQIINYVYYVKMDMKSLVLVCVLKTWSNHLIVVNVILRNVIMNDKSGNELTKTMEKGIPKMIDGKILTVAVLKSGEETTSLFTIEELKELAKEPECNHTCECIDCQWRCPRCYPRIRNRPQL